MKRAIATTMLLLSGLAAFAQNASDPRQAIERAPGDTEAAVKHLGTMLQDRFRKEIFVEFKEGRISRPNDSVHYAAKRILALHHMGKVSVHSSEVKSAFTYEFLTAFNDEIRLHEALALYKRIAVPNADDPVWRIMRARCARMLALPETLQLYQQVATDMTGVPPSEEVRKIWEANREEFDLPDFTKELWLRQSTTFVYDAKGLDVPGSPPIKGSPFSLLDIEGIFGAEAAMWNTALEGSPQTHAKMLDDIFAQTTKHGELPWLDGRGFLNTERALALHLQTKPTEEFAKLRELQETAFQKAIAKAKKQSVFALFRRYPYSKSAQQQLLQSAKQHLFNGEAQAAFRCFHDVLRHADGTELREEAQVGLWTSLTQFASDEVVNRAFDSVDPNATWPWYGKREKAVTIRQKLAKKSVVVSSPTLGSVRQQIVRLPPMRIFSERQNVLSIDMQQDGNKLLVSSPNMLALYRTDNLQKPAWIQRRRSSEGIPKLVGKKILTPFGDGSRLVTVGDAEGAIENEGDPHSPHTLYRYHTIGGPVSLDRRAYAVQFGQPYLSIYGHPENRNWGDVALSCFGSDLKHLWTRSYKSAQTIAILNRKYCNYVLPQVSQGAVYFCTNAGHVIRADCRDGEMEWMHFFRPVTGDNYRKSPSPWCLGAAPIVTGDKVICMPKLSGYLFALDKETGRRIWKLPLLRGHELLGVHEDQVLVIGANSLYSIDLSNGELRWGRKISQEWSDGFQLPRAQMIGSSVYCGTKKALYRFDAGNGAMLETRNWEMKGEVPMSFLIADIVLYVVSDLPIRDSAFERQLAEYHTVIHPAGGHRNLLKPVSLKDGSQVIWRDGMLICFKEQQVIWSRFVSNDSIYQSRMTEKGGKLSLSWKGHSAVYDSTTGELLSMRKSRAPKDIIIGNQ